MILTALHGEGAMESISVAPCTRDWAQSILEFWISREYGGEH